MMNNDKPFSFDDYNNEDNFHKIDDFQEINHQPLGNSTIYTTQETEDEGFVPTSNGSTTTVQNKDSNFVFFYGTSASGKSVILSAILYYMNSYAGVLRPKLGSPNSREAHVLLADFFENIKRGILPNRSTRDQVTRLDFVFDPNNKSKKVLPVSLSFLETNGENHNEISRGGKYHESIDAYLNSDIPLNFIIVTSYDRAHQEDAKIVEFLDYLERKGKNLKNVNVLLVISKWDKSGSMGVDNEQHLENFISERLSMTNNRIDTYNLNKTYFTIGNVQNQGGVEKITLLNLESAEVISKWLYNNIVGYDLDYEGTFWEKIKFSFSK
ncbi:hypothetical protein NG800_003085 [Epilithonimonas ginsengisoli]|uniref:ATP-binding protein n=1 Tax=Epilithonimonas ginsengisoli TaxID=1245592 RepID=A0ABU4JDZ4_9FLAO|nr:MULTISPECIES: hypothetical protein [Chryseobacterium group]MBV6879034.1 hypothetical protein [Epilithonimonas sp. FP105]MDW8547881.1 hypothetical protein [Epilithonimonas ginsengisoli]OAH74942.1 hypothetical protein AXA65_05615 [Chryseobacterium sp. FP211-J200]